MCTRFFNDYDLPIRLTLQSGPKQSLKLALPPKARIRLGSKVGEPILPRHGTHLERWVAGERIGRKKFEHAGVVVEQKQFRARHPRVFSPVAQGGEPEVPIKAGLIGRVDARRLGWVLRFVAKGIGDPCLAVARALESISRRSVVMTAKRP